MDEAMEEVVEEEMNRCFEALKKHQAIDVNYIDFLEVDKDVQVAGEQSIEEIVKEVMGKKKMKRLANKKRGLEILSKELRELQCKELRLQEQSSLVKSALALVGPDGPQPMMNTPVQLEMTPSLKKPGTRFNPGWGPLLPPSPSQVLALLNLDDVFSTWIFQGLISTLQLVEKLDRYPFRKKRKIDSVEQEEKTMNIKKEATTQVGSFFVQHLPRNPSMFSGEGVEDPRSWLKGYERVAKHNQWDETLCLANVYFYLTGTALKWYENNEESIQTWTEFMSQLENVFGKNESSRLRAEKILKTRAQLKGESTEYYIQDVLRLCKEVDPQMNEEDKISHLMKGIAEELYQALIPRDVHNTEQFVTECRRIESIHCKRVTPTKYERLPNVASLSDHDDRADLSSMIRQIVREEVQRALGSTREEPKISTIEDMVKEEIGRTLAPISKPRRSSPQKERPREFYNNRYVTQTIRPQQPKQVNGRRDTNEWRTTEGKPICFHCGRPGHKTQPVASPFPSGKLEDASYFGGKAAKFINPPLSTTLELKENYIDIKIEGKMTRALVDSGASYSVISERFRLKLRKIMFAETDVTLRVANGKIVRPKGRCTLKLDLNGLQESFDFVVMEDCSHEVILGWNFLKLSRAIIDSADDTLFLEKCLFEDTPKNSSPLYSELEYRIEPASIQLIEVASRDIPNDAIVVAECRKELLLERELTAPSSVISLTNNRGKLWVVNWSPYPKLIPQGMHVADSAVIEDSQLCTLADCNQVETEAEHSEDPKISEFFIDDSLVESQKEKLRNLLKNYTDIFEFSKRKQFKDVNVKHRINTGDHLPTKQRPYRVAPRERQIIQDEVNKMEKLDIIQPSESPWASPVVLIRKKDGSWRFCVDYRRLNKITKKDVYPLPRIDDTLDCLRGARFYSSMDLQSGYWQIDVEESDREKTAFITPDGLYEFKVMPFGLCNAPATFERMIDNLLKGLKWTICLCYLDDIIVFSDGFEEHLRRLQLVLNCLKKAGLCLNSKKCKFGAKTITVLGHEVSENGIRPDQEKIRAVRDFATPRSLKEVRSFLGLSSYYRRFIPNYAHVAQPLNDLLKKDSAFNWNQEEQNAFEALKSALISEPALGHFDYSSPTEIHTDASNYGIGAVLVQIQKGKERAIAYASRTLNKAEKNYSTTERECLAIIWAINKFRPYVFGQPFTIVTDHHSLCWLTNLKDPCGRLARWALRLQEFDVTVVYKSGRKHQDADCLSRSPLEYSEDMEKDIPSIVTLQNFSEEQMNDQAIRKIADKLQSSPNNSFVKIDNTLYRKNYDPMGKPWLLVVPRHLRQELLKNFHDSPTAGHLGFTKTYDRIRKKYYWPGMYRTVRRYVAHCSDCQRRKHQPQLPSGHLQPIPVPEVAFEKVGMDLLGRFPTSEGGNRWIIVCTDYLTKYAITKALPTSESMEVAKFFIEDVILKHGAPRELITDRGRNFTSSMISDLNNQCRITHRKTTAYHPQTNGLTERLNKTIADMLSMYVDVNHKDWDRILPFVTFAYNTAKQESTGFTPFFLVHGREAETPLDVLFPKLLPEDDDFIQTLGARAEEARKLARIHSMRSQGSNKHRYDAHHRNIIYQPGDLVWIFIPVRKVGYSEKLMRRYFGPYKVTRKISDVTYEVETFGNQLGRRKTKDLVHIGRMKPYLNPEDQEDQLEEDPEDDSTNFQEEDIPTERTQQPQTREEISGPITRSRALRLRMLANKKRGLEILSKELRELQCKELRLQEQSSLVKSALALVGPDGPQPMMNTPVQLEMTPSLCADAFRMLTVAYGEATLDRSNVYRWYKMFSEGREDVNDEERAGRPSTSTTDEKINEVEKMIFANRRITVREVAEDLNISIGSCHSIFIKDLGMRLVAAKFVPKLLNCDQKQHRMNIANEMLDSVRDDPNLLQRVITGDEAWVYGYDVETKAQSSQWKLPHEPRPKKARQVRSNVKVLLKVFFDCRGVVHHEFLPQGRTVNKEYYLQVMRNLREAIRQKRPDLWKNKKWLLHHDNAPAHTSLLVRDFLAKNNTLMMPQPPYSPDLAPCDFFLFPKLKRPMKGRRYATLDEIKTASKEELKKILKNDFLKCFEDWKKPLA
ncbi:K02A2.6-like, partial [Cordylochernes scorpioides]